MTSAAPAKVLELFGAYSEILADPRGDAERRERLARLRDFAVSQGMCGRAVSTVVHDYSHEFKADTYDQQRFMRFYHFIFFVGREKGHKNLSCDVALELWRVVLRGRFRLLDKWCEFVSGSNRLGITDDTWRQVLDFSRLVHEDLSNYDPQGAWPVLVDEFVDHLYACGLGVMRARSACDGGSPASPSAAPAQQFILCSSIGSKRRAQACPEEVDTISQRLSQLEASTSKRANRGGIFSRSAQMRQATGDSSGSGGVQQGAKQHGAFSLSGPGVLLGIGVMDVANTTEESGGYTSERVAAHFHRKGLGVPGALPPPLVGDGGHHSSGGGGGDLTMGEESSRLVRTLLGGGGGGASGLGSLSVDMAM